MKEYRTGTPRRAAVVFLCAVAFAACVLIVPPPAQAATKLPAPAWPHVKHSGWHGLKLSWKAVEGADGYAVYRWSKAKKRYVRRAWVKKASWRDTRLKADGRYSYKVAAYKKVKGEKRAGKRSYKVSAVAYSRGAEVVNPGRPRAVKLASKMKLGDWRTVDASVRASAFGKGAGAEGARPFSDEVRAVTSDDSIVTCFFNECIAVAPGSCRVWLVAANGARSKAVKVRVSHNPRPGRFSDPRNISFYDPEITDFLNARSDDLYWAGEEALMSRLWKWSAKAAYGKTPKFPKRMPASLRSRLLSLFSWSGFDESVYLQEVVFKDGNLRLRFHSDVSDSIYGAGWWAYELVGPHAYEDEACVARGWRYEDEKLLED